MLSLATGLTSAQAFAAGNDSWQALKKSGEVADVGGDDNKAIGLYAQALKLIPAQDVSSTLDVEARMATDYVHQYKFNIAAPLTKHIQTELPKLKATGKYDPEVLVSVKFLSEAYRSSFDGRLEMDKRRANFDKYESTSLDLGDLVAPNKQEIEHRRYDRARNYIYFREPENAEKVLTKLLASMTPQSQTYPRVQCALAVVQEKLKRPQMLQKVQVELTKKYGEVGALAKIAAAQLWAANYDALDQTGEKALAIASTKKPPPVEAEIEVLLSLLAGDDDRALYAKGEANARKLCDIVASSKGKNSDDFFAVRKRLISYLTKTGKLAEAKALRSKQPNNFDWLIEDEKKNPLSP